jgi:S1-C subfamily serine protease
MTVCRCGFTRAAQPAAQPAAAPVPPAVDARPPAVPAPVVPPPAQVATPPPTPADTGATPATAARASATRDESDAEPRHALRGALVVFAGFAALAGAWFTGTWPFPSAAAEEVVDPLRVEFTTAPEHGPRPSADVARPTAEAIPPPSPAPAAAGPALESPVAAAPAALLSTEEIVTRSLPAVVTVETRHGTGSGFYVSRDTVITNAHVVGGWSVVTLRSSSGTTTAADVVTSSAEWDLAVLKAQIVNHDQPTLALGETADVRIGGEVLAIGSPLGLRNTVTRGIVSGVRDAKRVNLIQTDAAINPGNSGGPLIDHYGRVIGVNTLKLVGETTEAIGFAVSIHHARALLGPEYVAPSSSAAAAQRKREFSLRKFDEAVLALAKRADAIEDDWRKFKPQCVQGNSEVIAPREWFALTDAPQPIVKSLGRCQTWMPFFVDSARRTKSAIVMYETTAVSGGVEPDELRRVRVKYNMTWGRW